MPIYEYSCAKCGKTIEVIQKMSDKPLKTHQECGGKLTKLISASGFQFKGTGWYVTDYARKSQPEGSSSGKESRESKETKTESSKTSEGSGTGSKPASESKPSSESKPAKPSSPDKAKKS